MLEKVEGIVVREVNYGDTSKIITLYTREHGRLSSLVKGIRTKNKLSSLSVALVGTTVVAVLYLKPGISVHLAKEISVKKSLYLVHSSLDKLNALYEFIEIMLFCTVPRDRNHKLFSLFEKYLAVLEKKEVYGYRGRLLVFKFLIEVLNLLGFGINFERMLQNEHTVESDLLKSDDNSTFYFHITEGGFSRKTDRFYQGIICTKQILSVICQVHRRTTEDVMDISATHDAIEGIDKMLYLYLSTHSEKEFKRKTRDVFLQMV